MRITISAFRASVGGYVGRGHVHPALLDAARESVAQAKATGTPRDAYVARCGDDLVLILAHDGPSGEVSRVAREAFACAAEVAVRLGQHGAHAPGTNGGIAVQSADLTFDERPSEPVLCLLADKAGAGTMNLSLYRTFADPFNSPSLLVDPAAFQGFRFVVVDRTTDERKAFDLPDDLHWLLAVAGDGSRYVIEQVLSRATGEPAAAASCGDDPVAIVRCETGLPSVGEALEPFAFPQAVAGWGDGSYAGPLMPVSTNDDMASRFDGPPRVIGLGFQVAGGRLVGPRDLLSDRAFDDARRTALEAARWMRGHGPFAPQRARLDVARAPTPLA